MTEDGSYPQTAAECAEAYRELPGWTRGEIEGLTEARLDRTGPEEWAEWPPRRQVSHMAYITTRWLMIWYGAISLPWDPFDMSQFGTFINTPQDDRRFAEARYRDPEWLLARLEEACAAAADRLDGLEKNPRDDRTLLFVFPAEVRLGATQERVLDLWSRTAACHSDGVFPDPGYPGGFRMTPLGTLRHTLWDDLIHLRSLRMHREAMGLAPVHPEAPVGGYGPAYPVR